VAVEEDANPQLSGQRCREQEPGVGDYSAVIEDDLEVL